MTIAVGMRVGKYRLDRQLGAGGFGMVFIARDEALDRDCALKFLLPQHTANDGLVRRFLQEARLAAKIQHLGIVTVFECAQTDGHTYIAMELLQGVTLAERLMRMGSLPLPTAIAVARQIASALGAAHRAGIIHRDLKPDNVFLVPDPESAIGERVKVLDFGVAKLGEVPTSPVTAAYAIFGSPRYMSPEQCLSATNVDVRTDIYALGVMLFEMLAGRRPFDGQPYELIQMHQDRRPPRLASFAAVPPELDAIVDRMLAKSPDARPHSMEEVQALLEPYRGAPVLMPVVMPPVVAPSLPVVQPRREPIAHGETQMTGVAQPPAQSSPRRRTWLYLVLALVVVSAGITVAAVFGGKSATPERVATADAGAARDAPPPGDAIATVPVPDAAPIVDDPGPPATFDALTPTLEELRLATHAGISIANSALIAALLRPSAFGIGPRASDATAGSRVATNLIASLGKAPPTGFTVRSVEHRTVTQGNAAWSYERLAIANAGELATTQLAVKTTGGNWRIGAWHVARLIGNREANELAKSGKLAAPAAIGSRNEGTAIHTACGKAFSSRDTLVAALSTRDDSLVVGSAPGELVVGHAAITRWLETNNVKIRLRDGHAAELVRPDAGYCAANVEYGNHTYRVLAVLVLESGTWRVAMTQWSLAS